MTPVPIRRILRPTILTILTSVSPPPTNAFASPPPTSQPTFQVGQITDLHLPELSGLAPSRKYPNTFWAHNDSGNPPELFAITRTGDVIARIPVQNAPNVDWEDIAIDDHDRLYIADTGNNNQPRNEVHLYRFDEPDPRNPAPIKPTAHWTIRHTPGNAFDCEALFVHNDYAYLLPKLRSLRPPTLYRFPLTPTDQPVTLEPLGPLPSIQGPVTAATLSPDHRLLAILTVLGPTILQINDDPTNALTAKPTGHTTFVSPRMEAASFTPDGLLVGTEERDLFLFTWPDLGMPAPKSPETKPSPPR